MFPILWNSVRVPFFDSLVCLQCSATMKVIAFLTDYAVVDRIFHHLKLSFVADKPPTPHPLRPRPPGIVCLKERILSWRHTGFNVHSRVRAKTRKEAERVGKHMIRPLLSLERLSFSEKEGQVCYRYGKEPGQGNEYFTSLGSLIGCPLEALIGRGKNFLNDFTSSNLAPWMMGRS